MYSSGSDGILKLYWAGEWRLPYMAPEDQPLSREAARVVCSSMGMKEAATQPPNPFDYGWPRGPILPVLEAVVCSGAEASLLQCGLRVGTVQVDGSTPVAVACVDLGEWESSREGGAETFRQGPGTM
ncbi:hypothetical protein TSOC_004031, partial [Tetrabaena socialis]